MWTQFWDMNSGGGQKLEWKYIYIELPEEEACKVFYNRFDRNPHRAILHRHHVARKIDFAFGIDTSPPPMGQMLRHTLDRLRVLASTGHRNYTQPIQNPSPKTTTAMVRLRCHQKDRWPAMCTPQQMEN